MADALTRPRIGFYFFGGKGGVGKTTCAAAAALRAASEGARALIVSTDPAHSLADALAQPLGPDARRVEGAPGELYAAELNADRALGRWVRARSQAFRTIAERGTYLDEEDIDRLLSLSFPGVDELVGLLELVRLAGVRRYDKVVIDTAPTGHTLRLLEMPETLARLAQVLDDMHEKHRLITSFGSAWRPDFADEVIDEIAGEASSLRALLTDPTRAAFTWVTLPEELPVLESEDAAQALERLGMAIEVVVINRVWPLSDGACARCIDRVRAERGWRLRVAERFAGSRVVEVESRIVEPRGPDALLDFAYAVREAAVPPEPPPPRAAKAPERGGPAARLDIIPETTALVIFGGKGGVGKTSAAAAAALDLAAQRPRDRILALSTDPAHSLGDAFAAPLSDEERPIPGGPPNLVARELDAAHAWAVQRDRYREAIDDAFSSIFRGRMDAAYDRIIFQDLLDLAPPGIDELLALVSMIEALAPPARYELVVLDTAPTGHTLRLLELPQKALEWVHTLMATVLKYRNVVGLGEFAKDLTKLARQLRALIALLADPARAAFVAVTRPAELPRLETERLVRKLRELEVPVAEILVNAVTEPGCPRCDAAVEAERAELARLARLASLASPGPSRSKALLIAPATYPGPRGLASLARWRSTWRRATPPDTP